MPGIGFGVSFVLNESEPDGSKCSACGELIVTKMYTLYMSVDSSLSETGFQLEKINKQFCEFCKPDLE